MSARTQRGREVTVAGALFVAALAYFSLSFPRVPLDLEDEGLFLYHSARVANGEIPYRDFVDVYGPGVFAITGSALAASGGSIFAVRALLAAWKAAAVVLTFLLARTVTDRRVAALGSLVAMAYWGRSSWYLNVPYAAYYTITVCLAACLMLIRALRLDASRAYALAGLIGGAAIPLKHSLGLVNAFGMMLAVCAVAALDAPPGARSRRRGLGFLCLWIPSASLLLVPAWTTLGPSDYALHFLALHAFMALVAVGAMVRGGCPPIGPTFRRRLVPLAIGLAALPSLTAAWLVAHGAAPARIAFNLVTIPLTLENYYLAVPPPPPARTLLVIGAVAGISGALLALRGRRLGSATLALSSLLALAVAIQLAPEDALQTVGGRPLPRAARDWPELVWTAPSFLAGSESGLLVLAAALTLAPSLLDRRRPVDGRALRSLVPLVFFHATLSFAVFPRGSFNIWIIQGACVPLLSILVWRWYGLGVSTASRLPARIAALGLVFVVPFWMVAPSVGRVVRSALSSGVRQPLALAQTRGLAWDRRAMEAMHGRDLEALVAFLRGTEPRDAPVLLLTNEFMVLYLSGRPHLLADRDEMFYWLAWRQLPEAQRPQVAPDLILRRLRDTPDALIVAADDFAAENLLSAIPGLGEAIARDYQALGRFGPYTVYRSAAAPGAR